MAKVVGILGGMGPMSTVDLMRKVTEKTPVQKEQEHLRLLVDSRPQVPDRTAAIFGEGPSPAPVLQESARLLEAWGADMIAIPCNSAHAFLGEIRDAVGIEVLDMPGVVGREIANRIPSGAAVGLLGTSGSYRAGLYHSRLPDHQVVTPSDEVQEELVMAAIYQVKVEDKVEEPRRKLLEAASTLDPAPAALIAGCTEVELAFEGAEGPVPIFMPMDLLAEEIVNRAWREG
ncbi:MAG: amino acid racemase [Gemmatimonadetes bacterium]|nr:amino acid racemase [Gemmatimonadota bacterium]NNM07256.1 amino acid racemase [Gemmatimonadota bacterium]